MNVVDGMTLIYLPIYFKWIIKHWLYYEIFGFCILCTGTLAFSFLPESPGFYYSNKKYDQARKVFSKIARVNRVKNYDPDFKFDTEIEEKDPNFSDLV